MYRDGGDDEVFELKGLEMNADKFIHISHFNAKKVVCFKQLIQTILSSD